MAMQETDFPSLKPTFQRLPDLAVHQLRASIDNINGLYGSRLRAVGFDVLGTISNEDDRRETLQWICANAVIPFGDLMQPRTIQVRPLASIEDRTDEDREAFEACVAERITIGDFVVATQFTDPDLGAFQSIAVVDEEGIRYDPLLFGLFTFEQGHLDPCSARTDCEWWRFGWIWQSGFANLTRGEVKMCLTVICDNAGNAVDCLTSKHCFMQLGDCDVDIANVVRRGRCCRAECAWGVATGTISAKVKLNLGRLTVEFSGVFGSTAKGGRTLRDCCPARAPIPAPASSESQIDPKTVHRIATRSGADPASARQISQEVMDRLGDLGAGAETLESVVFDALNARNPEWAATFLDQSSTSGGGRRGCGCS